MKKVLALLLCSMLVLAAVPAAFAVNEDVEGELTIYSSMYQFVIDMMDEALKKEFPNLVPGNNGSFFFYGGTSSLITKIYGEMDTGTLGCDMMLVAEPAFSLELKDAGYLQPIAIDNPAQLLRFPYDEEGYWYPVRVCNMVLAYNPEKYQKSEVPNSFKDFAENSDYKGALSMSNPLTSGTAYSTVVAL